MASRAHRSGWALLPVSIGLILTGCYKPSITDGGLICAEAGKPCPDGFSCDPTDNHCHTGSALVEDASTCSVPPVAKLCDDLPGPGQDCNPICQVGCSCGRCNISSTGDGVCTISPGSKTVGQVCLISAADDCAPGLACIQEACGNNLARCRRICQNNGQCTTGFCQVAIKLPNSDGATSMYQACELGAQTCDPVVNTGCPSGLNCYVGNGTDTLCDCPSKPTPGGLGDSCFLTNDCTPGLICITTGTSGTHCQQLCKVATPICPTGRPTCTPVVAGTSYGYCS
jgi:hypothetical protein